MTYRKALLILLAIGALAVPLLTDAQQPAKVWRIGLFHVGLDHVPPSLEVLRESLRTLGYEEGRNIHLDWRNQADEDAARVTAREFVRERVDLIVAFENQTVRAAKDATSDIPVVFLHVDDPVAEGFVKSLAHPGGNVTGIVSINDVPAKEVELFKELVPRLRRLLILIDPQDPAAGRLRAEVRKAGTALKLRLVERDAKDQADIERVFGTLRPGDVDGVFVVSPNLQTKFTSRVLQLASERRLPLRSHRKEWVEQGALFSYGANFAAVGKDAARYVDRILKGAKPSDLPVEQPTKFELVINLKTAKALGLTIPQSILIRADEVIQ